MPFLPAWLRRNGFTEAKTPAPVQHAQAGKVANRSGFVQGIPPQGLDENQNAFGAATQTDRPTFLQELWEAYLTCPWSWACVNAIARTITAGGLVTDWDSDDGEGKPQPAKPPAVEALERFLGFCNPVQDIRQLMRNVVCDLLVFGDAFLEVVWLGKLPVALFNLDCPTTTPVTDEHGNVTKYVQVTEFGQRAEFEPREVIHISLDSARPSVFGVSPTHAAQTSIITWLFLAGVLKELGRKGIPPVIHADHPASTPDKTVTRWQEQYVVRNLGPQNIGTPIVTKGGGVVNQLQGERIADLIAAKTQSRDEIVAAYGVPPAKAGIIESGNLGGGTGAEQNRTYQLDTCQPIAELIIEKIQFHIAVQGFGVEGWRLKFADVDYRDDLETEQIRDMRLRNGSWTRNRYAAAIGEPPTDGGDLPVLVDRQNLVLWKDMDAMSKATVASKAGAAAGPGMFGQQPPRQQDGPAAEARARIGRQVATYFRERRALNPVTEGKVPSQDKVRAAVTSQLAEDFPPDAIRWAEDAVWSGPQWVPAERIDTTHEASWVAANDGSAAHWRKKLRKRRAKGRHLKPAVLVRTPHSTHDVIADGHHRALAYLTGEGRVWAYVGKVDRTEGPWLSMHDRDIRGQSGHRQHAGAK